MKATGRLLPSRARRGRGRAVTLLEVIVAMVFTGVLVLMMLGFVEAIFTSSNGVAANNSASVGSTLLTSKLGSDLSSAVVCQTSGLGVPYHNFSSGEIGLYEPSSVAGSDNLVLWRYNNDELQRAVIAPSSPGSCDFDASGATWQSVASNIVSAQFVPSYLGTQVADPSGVGETNCTGAAGTDTAPENCYFDNVTLDATLQGTSGVSSAVVTLDKSWPVSLASSQLAGPSQSEVVGVPGSPTEIAGTDYANAQSVVSWSPPSDNGGSSITGYVLQYSSDGGQSWTSDSDTISSSPYTLTGLTDGTGYVVEVAALNSQGTGSWSGPSAPITPSTLPGAPGDVVAGSSGGGQAALSWNAPLSDGGAPVIAYVVQYSADGGTTWTTFPTTGAAPAAKVTGLSNGTNYTFQVAAVNGSGTGPFAQSSGSIVPANVPSAPTSVVATNYQDSSSDVTWSAPSSAGGFGYHLVHGHGLSRRSLVHHYWGYDL